LCCDVDGLLNNHQWLFLRDSFMGLEFVAFLNGKYFKGIIFYLMMGLFEEVIQFKMVFQ
jgi:hypothetical protein